MKRPLEGVRLVTLLFGLCACGSAAGDSVLRFHASTPQQIIDALAAAGTHNGVTLVYIAPGEYIFSQTFESEFGPSVLPPVTSTVVLLGQDADTTRLNGAGLARLITLDGGRLSIRGITLTRGVFSNLEGEQPPSNVVRGGGAVASFGGTLHLADCIVTRNGASTLFDTSGGAILSVDGWLLIEGTTLTDNHVDGAGGAAGGAIGLNSGKGFIRQSIIRGNSAFGQFYASAGGVGIGSEATLVISRSTVAGNSAAVSELENATRGGGITTGGTLWLIDSAVVENMTRQPNSEQSFGPGYGGGIANGGELHVVNSTIGGNVGTTSGGGIFNTGTVRLLGATIAGNQALGLPDVFASPDPNCNLATPQLCIVGGGGIWNEGDAQVRSTSSVIASNHAAVDSEQTIGPDCTGVIRSKGFNAVGDARDCEVQPSSDGAGGLDQLGVDPRLAELVDDGSPGNAHFPLLPDSPLIDAGGKVFKQCAPRDQIGQRRNDGDLDGRIRCDTGAIEFQ